MTQEIIIEADGGSRGNPGSSGSGTLLLDKATGQVIAEAAVFHGVATNNYAEYKAVIIGFELANELAPDANVTVRVDSKLVVEQASGRWKVKHDSMAELMAELRQLIGSRNVLFEWVPREENVRADSLANEAMDAEKSVVRKFVGEPGTSSIQVVTESTARASDLEYNPELPSSVRAPRDISKKLTTVILVRHGRTALTESHRISGRGGEDPVLSTVGLEDANRVAKELAKIGKSGLLGSVKAPAVIISSPLARTLETAGVISKMLDIPIAVEDDLAEIAFGEWDGHTNQQVAEKWPDLYQAWRGDVSITPPGGGESIIEFDSRIQKVRSKIISDYEGQTVIVVSHVMPIRGFLKRAMDADWPAYWRVSVAPCSITALRFWGEEAAEVSFVNYSGHL